MMEATRPPPSPLSGGYLLIVISEPQIETHKAAILKKISKDFLSWDVNESGIDIERELAIVTALAPEGDLSKSGERLIQNVSENLVTEILIQPQINTLRQCVRNLLSSFTKYKFIIHAGYTFCGNGSWILQDGTFSMADFVDAFQEIEVQRVIRAYEKTVKIDVCCISECGWDQARIDQESFSKFCRVVINPNDKLPSGSIAINEFSQYLDSFIVAQDIGDVLEPSDVVGNIRFTRPTLYVFPSGDGDAALFGINGFNMLVDGGFSRRACFWNFVRHLDRLDAVLFSRINNTNIGGMAGIVQRKVFSPVYPQIGHFFANLQIRKRLPSPDGDKDKDPLLLNLIDEGDRMVMNLKHLQLKPHLCYRDPNNEPINLYHKVGHGKLDMYVLNPAKDSHEVKEFLSRWHSHDIKLFDTTAENVKHGERELRIPLQNLVSICALIVWQPANPEDHVTRILFPGSVPQSEIFEGLKRIKTLEFFKSPICLMKTIHPATQISNIKKMKISTEEKILHSKSEKIIPDSDAIQLKSELAENENVVATNRTITADEKMKKAQPRRKRTERSPTINLKEAKTTHTIKDTQLKQSTEKLAENKISEKKEIITNKAEIKKTEKKIIPIEKKIKPVNIEKKTDSEKSSPITQKKSFTSVKDSISISTSTTKDSLATSVSTATVKDSSSIATAMRDSSSIKSTTTSTRSTSAGKTSPKILPAKHVKEENNRRMLAAKHDRGVTPPKVVISTQTTILTTSTTESSKPVKKEQIKPKPASVKIPKQTATLATTCTTSTTATKSVRRPITTRKLEDDKKSHKLEGQTTALQTTTKKQSIDSATEIKETGVLTEVLADVTKDEFYTTDIQTTDSGSAAVHVSRIITQEAENDENDILIIETTEIEPVTVTFIDNEESKYSLDEKESEKNTPKNLITSEKENGMQVMETQIDKEEDLEKIVTEAPLSSEQHQNLNYQLNGNIEKDTEIITNRKKSDETIEKYWEIHKKEEIVAESADDIIENISEDKSSTTAPTMPEDERIKQEIEEKSDKEETKEKKKIILADIVHHKVSDKTSLIEANLPAILTAQQKKIIISTSVVKTPDEVADLPVHEEVDIKQIYDTNSRKLKTEEEPIITAVVEAQIPEIVNITPSSSPDEKTAPFPKPATDNQCLNADNLLPEGLPPITEGQDLDIINETNTDDNLIEISSQIKDETNNILDEQHLAIKKELFVYKRLDVENGQKNLMQQGGYLSNISNDTPETREDSEFAYQDKSVKLKSSTLTKLEMEGLEEAQTLKSSEETSEKTESKNLVDKELELPKEIIRSPNLNEEFKCSQLFDLKQPSSVVHTVPSPTESVNMDKKYQTQQLIDGNTLILAQQEKYEEQRFLSDSKDHLSNGGLIEQKLFQQDLCKSKEVIDEGYNSIKELGTDDKRKDSINIEDQKVSTETESKSGIESFALLKIQHSGDTEKDFTLDDKGGTESALKEELLESRKVSIQIEKPKGTSHSSPSESSPEVDKRSEDQLRDQISLTSIEDTTFSEHMLPKTDKEIGIPFKKSHKHSISSPDEETCKHNQNISPEIDVKGSVQLKVSDKPVVTTSPKPNTEQSPDEILSRNINNKSLDQLSIELKSSLELNYSDEISSKMDEKSLIQFEKQENHIKSEDSSTGDKSTADMSLSERIYEIDNKIPDQKKETKQIQKITDLVFDDSQSSANQKISTKTDNTHSVQLEKQKGHPFPTITDSSSVQLESLQLSMKIDSSLDDKLNIEPRQSEIKTSETDTEHVEMKKPQNISLSKHSKLNDEKPCVELSPSEKKVHNGNKKFSVQYEESQKVTVSKNSYHSEKSNIVSSPSEVETSKTETEIIHSEELQKLSTSKDSSSTEIISYETDKEGVQLEISQNLSLSKHSNIEDQRTSVEVSPSEKIVHDIDEKSSVQCEESEVAEKKDVHPSEKYSMKSSSETNISENDKEIVHLEELQKLSPNEDLSPTERLFKTDKESGQLEKSQKSSLSKQSSIDDQKTHMDLSPSEKIEHEIDKKSLTHFNELQKITVGKDSYPSEKANIVSSPGEKVTSKTNTEIIHLEELQKLSPSKDSCSIERMSPGTDKEGVQLEISPNLSLSKHSNIEDQRSTIQLSPSEKIVHDIDIKSSVQCEESQVAENKDAHPSEKYSMKSSPSEKNISENDKEIVHLEELQKLSSNEDLSPTEGRLFKTDKESGQLGKSQKSSLSKQSSIDDQKTHIALSPSEKIGHEIDEKSSTYFKELQKITVGKDSYPSENSDVVLSPGEKVTSKTDTEIIHLEELQKLSPSKDSCSTERISQEIDKEGVQLEISQKLSLSKHSSTDNQSSSVELSPSEKIVHDIDKKSSVQGEESQATANKDAHPSEKYNTELSSSERMISETDKEIVHLEGLQKLSPSEDLSATERMFFETDKESGQLEKSQKSSLSKQTSIDDEKTCMGSSPSEKIKHIINKKSSTQFKEYQKVKVSKDSHHSEKSNIISSFNEEVTCKTDTEIIHLKELPKPSPSSDLSTTEKMPFETDKESVQLKILQKSSLSKLSSTDDEKPNAEMTLSEIIMHDSDKQSSAQFEESHVLIVSDVNYPSEKSNIELSPSEKITSETDKETIDLEELQKLSPSKDTSFTERISLETDKESVQIEKLEKLYLSKCFNIDDRRSSVELNPSGTLVHGIDEKSSAEFEELQQITSHPSEKYNTESGPSEKMLSEADKEIIHLEGFPKSSPSKDSIITERMSHETDKESVQLEISQKSSLSKDSCLDDEKPNVDLSYSEQIVHEIDKNSSTQFEECQQVSVSKDSSFSGKSNIELSFSEKVTSKTDAEIINLKELPKPTLSKDPSTTEGIPLETIKVSVQLEMSQKSSLSKPSNDDEKPRVELSFSEKIMHDSDKQSSAQFEESQILTVSNNLSDKSNIELSPSEKISPEIEKETIHLEEFQKLSSIIDSRSIEIMSLETDKVSVQLEKSQKSSLSNHSSIDDQRTSIEPSPSEKIVHDIDTKNSVQFEESQEVTVSKDFYPNEKYNRESSSSDKINSEANKEIINLEGLPEPLPSKDSIISETRPLETDKDSVQFQISQKSTSSKDSSIDDEKLSVYSRSSEKIMHDIDKNISAQFVELQKTVSENLYPSEESNVELCPNEKETSKTDAEAVHLEEQKKLSPNKYSSHTERMSLDIDKGSVQFENIQKSSSSKHPSINDGKPNVERSPSEKGVYDIDKKISSHLDDSQKIAVSKDYYTNNKSNIESSSSEKVPSRTDTDFNQLKELPKPPSSRDLSTTERMPLETDKESVHLEISEKSSLSVHSTIDDEKSNVELSPSEKIMHDPDKQSSTQFEESQIHIVSNDNYPGEKSNIELSLSEKITSETVKETIHLKEVQKLLPSKDSNSTERMSIETDKESVHLEKSQKSYLTKHSGIEDQTPSVELSTTEKMVHDNDEKCSAQIEESKKVTESKDAYSIEKYNTESMISEPDNEIIQLEGLRKLSPNEDLSSTKRLSIKTDKENGQLEKSQKSFLSKKSSIDDENTSIDFPNENIVHEMDKRTSAQFEESQKLTKNKSSYPGEKSDMELSSGEKVSSKTDKATIHLEVSQKSPSSKDSNSTQNISFVTDKESVQLETSPKSYFSTHSSISDEKPRVELSPSEKTTDDIDKKSSALFEESQKVTVSKDSFFSEKSNTELSASEKLASMTETETINLQELQIISISKDSSPTRRISLETDKESVQLKISLKPCLSKHSSIDDEKPSVELSPIEKIVHNIDEKSSAQFNEGSELNSKSTSLPVFKRSDESENLINMPYLCKSANLEDLTSAECTEVEQLQSQSDLIHSTTYHVTSTEIEMFHDAGSSISATAPMRGTKEPVPTDEKVLTNTHANKYEEIQKYTSDDESGTDNQKLKHDSRTYSNKEETDIKSTITSLAGVQISDHSSSNTEKETEIFSSVQASMMQSFYGTLSDDDIEGVDDENETFEESRSTFISETTTEANSPATTSDSTSVVNVTTTSITSTSSPSDTDPIAGWGKPLGLPLGKSANSLNTLLIWNPFESWGKPFGLPSPGPPQSLTPPSLPSQHRNSDSDIELNLTPINNKTTPKKVVSNKSTNERVKDISKTRDMSVTKKQIRNSKQVTPVYVDLAYIPHHGNPQYTNIEFFKRIRARYYVFSGTDAAKDVFDALLEAKKSWDNQDLEVTIIPTYDTDVLGYWITENEEALSNLKIDLAPSASRCTINLQDHDTSCSAYRLEF